MTARVRIPSSRVIGIKYRRLFPARERGEQKKFLVKNQPAWRVIFLPLQPVGYARATVGRFLFVIAITTVVPWSEVHLPLPLACVPHTRILHRGATCCTSLRAP